MPKVKTNSGAKKRFALTGTGKIKRKHAFHSHILTKKTKKQKRNLCHVGLVYSIECPARKCHFPDRRQSQPNLLCQDQ